MEEIRKQNARIKGADAKLPSKSAHRRNLYLTDELFQSIETAAVDMGYHSSTELIRAALRIIILGHKHYLSEDHGLFWKNGERYERVFMEMVPPSF